MTSFDSSDPSFDTSLHGPGALIAALPAVLGFVPESSTVLVTFDGGGLACVMRADLCPDSFDGVRQMAEVAGANQADGAVLVIVDRDVATCGGCRDDYQAIWRAVEEVLAGHGVELWAAHVVDKVERGGRWHCVDGCGNHGEVDDPSSSPLAVAAVVDGRPLYQNRAELLEVITPTDADRAASLLSLIERRLRGGKRRTRDVARGDVEHALATMSDLAAGGSVTDADMARVACALSDAQVRDTMYALAVGSESHHAESLWGLLARGLPSPWRVEALVLLAFSAYARGDGTLAGVALEAALDDALEHEMAGMLDLALKSGMRPEQVRELARTGYRLAKRLGVQLPPRRIFGRGTSFGGG